MKSIRRWDREEIRSARTERGRKPFLLDLPSGTSRAGPDEAGGRSALRFLSQRSRRHGSVRAKGSNASAGGVSSAAASAATGRLRNAAAAARLYPGSFAPLPAIIRSSSSCAKRRAIPMCSASIISAIIAADIPPVEKGRKLDCNYCHKTDPEGRFYQRVSFDANCQACHALQFDKNNPQLQIPHGDVNLVRTFLRTLPAQYGDYARLKQGKTSDSDVQSFVAPTDQAIAGAISVSGEELERAVFFTNDPYKPQRQATAAIRANYAGCALCHDVKTDRRTARRRSRNRSWSIAGCRRRNSITRNIRSIQHAGEVGLQQVPSGAGKVARRPMCSCRRRRIA